MPKRRYTDEQLIDLLQEAAIILGRTPTMRDFDSKRLRKLKPKPGSYTYKTRFKSWSNALRKAFGEHVASAQARGLADDDKLREDMRELAAELGRAPTAVEMSEMPGAHHANTYIRHYGTWNKAVRSILNG